MQKETPTQVLARLDKASDAPLTWLQIAALAEHELMHEKHLALARWNKAMDAAMDAIIANARVRTPNAR
jgi:hypothetical protein